MASAWGNSWGVAWGNSWGGTTPVPPPDYAHFGGGGFNEYRARKKRDYDEELRRGVMLAMGLLESPESEIRKEAKSIVRIAKPAEQIDYAVILSSKRKSKAIWARIEKLTALVREIEQRIADDEDDDVVMLFFN